MTSSHELGPSQTQKSFDVYRDLLRPVNEAHPQHQGFSVEEFNEALSNPGVITTEVEVGDQLRIALPQLAPVEAYGWLHAPFYEKQFPDDHANGQILHFSDLPGVVPGERVNERLRELAQQRGVLVFDSPSSDPRQPARILQHLESLGIRTREPGDIGRKISHLEAPQIAPGSVELLGTQTYHVGRVALKREHPVRDPHLTYAQAFDEMVARGEVDQAQFIDGVSMHEVIEGQEAIGLQRLYDAAYETISDHPCGQGLTPDEFGKKLLDRSTSKAVFRRDGVAESLCLVTEDLSGLTWVNKEFYGTPRFKQRFGEGPVTWYPGIATDPESAGHNMGEIIRLFTKLSEVGDNSSVVVFDTPDVNTGFLDVVLAEMINSSPEASIDFTRIGDQKYCAVRLEPAA